MKRIVFSIMVAFFATFAMAQVENVATKGSVWEEEFTQIGRRISEISQKFSNEGLSQEQKELIVKEYYEQADKLIELAKTVVKDGSEPELAAKMVEMAGPMAEYEDLLVLMPANAPYFNNPEMAELRTRMEMMARRAPGIQYTDLTMPDMNGKKRSLSEWCAKGNYVLVDFWASWCRPCREEMPNVVEAYNRYHDKGFDVVGVSFDNNKEAWTKAVSDLGLSWHHISDLKGWECAAAPVYGIQSIPANILVDPNGKIVAADLRAESLLEKLAEIYKD
ncbi:MAG: TlpA disulfide reductase family protein [Prevotella sp.]|uniref:peroxiredoxin family protein n=1 Tax=Prevotella sp. TaxID=59823 RepID=UPI002A2BC709|nr:TlpA disulfide reductase family protein [Prevotella sp.]MDD7317499.1 TlpA disulfide reductase family protein [Prevotellaceae bacterium]MDY4019165.1 TlpA disulfide reductase family protein [Prevotella sp.]